MCLVIQKQKQTLKLEDDLQKHFKEGNKKTINCTKMFYLVHWWGRFTHVETKCQIMLDEKKYILKKRKHNWIYGSCFTNQACLQESKLAFTGVHVGGCGWQIIHPASQNPVWSVLLCIPLLLQDPLRLPMENRKDIHKTAPGQIDTNVTFSNGCN